MECESPDVEMDFPGLYASEAQRKCNESDFSDEAHDKSFKKDLIIGKKKERKDSKKDRGYATLEGESSPDEDLASRSPCKSKKSKSFKFSTKKTEKREKSREKDTEKRDKDSEKDKKKDKEKKEKEKIKNKEKKKIKAGEEIVEPNEDFPIFGVDLSIAVDRNGCLDGVPIPLVVRNCIDCIHSFGLNMDGLYKTVAMKSKVQNAKKAYNAREPVSMGECDVPIAACLLRIFLRELPEPILTNDLLTRFEEVGAIMEVDVRERELQSLIAQLPVHNRVLLGWLVVHFDTVTLHEKHNKLNAQSMAMIFSPVLQMSHRLLTALLCHCKALFSNITIKRYIPPLCPGSSFPEKSDEIALELSKQESLLNQIHREMNEGFVSKKKEEQLWEVQRIVTQLKRKLKGLQRFQEATFAQKSAEEEHSVNEENGMEMKKQISEKEESSIKQMDSRENSTENAKNEEETGSNNVENKSVENKSVENKSVENKSVENKSVENKSVENKSADSISEDESETETIQEKEKNFLEQLECDELLKLQRSLQERIKKEKELISKLKLKIQGYMSSNLASLEEEENTSSANKAVSEVNIEQLNKDYHTLRSTMSELSSKIFEERLTCIILKVLINIFEMPEG